jgi:hypothetical protein
MTRDRLAAPIIGKSANLLEYRKAQLFAGIDKG